MLCRESVQCVDRHTVYRRRGKDRKAEGAERRPVNRSRGQSCVFIWLHIYLCVFLESSSLTSTWKCESESKVCAARLACFSRLYA